jgi:hypothetical protein
MSTREAIGFNCTKCFSQSQTEISKPEKVADYDWYVVKIIPFETLRLELQDLQTPKVEELE